MKQKCIRDCDHEYQDKRYGKGMRVHTEPLKGDPRCTVCSEASLTKKMRSIATSPSWNPACALKPTKMKVVGKHIHVG